MQIEKSIALIWKILYKTLLLTILISASGVGSLTSVYAQTVINGISMQVNGYVLSNGQFVYGPNVGDFNLKAYLHDNAPHLDIYADELYGRSEYFSINPKVYLTLLELHGNLISSPDAVRVEDPFDIPDLDFISQTEKISEVMFDTYYLHLYTYSALPPSQRSLPSFVTQDGEVIEIRSDTNAGTYAVIAALARMENEQRISEILDNNQPNGFYQTYIRLFGQDDPLDEQNYIYVPGLSASKDTQYLSEPMGAGPLTPPDSLLQLPYTRGQSWKFGGVHDNGGGGGVGSALNDASSMDFYPAGLSWGADTSNMWVVAGAGGSPTKISACYFKILHTDGWETTYYHLENIQTYSGSINQNDKIGVIANTLAEAICNGGSSTGPHVHFTLRKNGALVAIDGSALSGWYIHAGRWNYDTDKNYMWLERDGIKKYAYGDLLLSEMPPAAPSITGNTGVVGVTLNYVDGTTKNVTSKADGSYSFQVSPGWSGTVTPTHPCFTFDPVSRTYSSVSANQPNQDYSAMRIPSMVCVLSIMRAGPDPTNASSVDFTVTFSEPVMGVDTTAPYSDFVLTTSLTGASITNVNGSGATYTVTVNTGSGNGTVRLDVMDDNTIMDAASNPLGGVNAGDGDFTIGEAYTITTNPIFGDVPLTHPYYDAIEILYANGYTGGCSTSPLLFCPDVNMSRAQSAVFMLRGNFGSGYVPVTPTHFFADNWQNSSWGEGWAESMYQEGLTGGCSSLPLKFCPDVTLSNVQLAVFGLRLKYGMNYAPPPATGTVFADMTDVNFWGTGWAEKAYVDGLIPACGTSGGKPLFCPDALVSRGFGASVIVKAKNLTMP